MKIIDMIKNHGANLTEDPDSGRGYKRTEAGVTLTRKKDEADRWFSMLRLNGKFLPKSKSKVYFTAGTKYEGATKEEIEIAAQNGEIDSFVMADLYQEYYDLDNDSDGNAIENHGCSARTWNYITSIMEHIGLVDINEGEDMIYIDNGEVFPIYWVADTIVGMIDGKWCATTTLPSPESYTQIKMWFNKKPSREDIETAFQIRRAIYSICWHTGAEVFRCWECGHIVNWLDCDSGNLSDILDRAENKYCGMC